MKRPPDIFLILKEYRGTGDRGEVIMVFLTSVPLLRMEIMSLVDKL